MSDVVKISFPDGAVKEFPRGTTTEDIAASISPGLKKKAIAGKWNGTMFDLRRPIMEDGSIEIVVPESSDALEVLRHSTAHLMAQAVRRLYPGVNLGVGPVIEGGFYYDFQLPTPLTDDDFPLIEAEMKKIIALDEPFERIEVPRAKALEIVKGIDQHYKVEHIETGRATHPEL